MTTGPRLVSCTTVKSDLSYSIINVSFEPQAVVFFLSFLSLLNAQCFDYNITVAAAYNRNATYILIFYYSYFLNRLSER